MKRPYIILFGLLATLVVVGGAYFFLTKQSTISTSGSFFAASSASSQPASSSSEDHFVAAYEQPQPPKPATSRVVPADAKEYKNNFYHFSLFYPKELVLNEYDEGGTAKTITFQNTQTAEGFQVFITPYNESQVTPERFKQDEPSGVQNNLKNITIGTATGASFYSVNASLGDTYEVWFIKNNYLYEVTTLKPLDTWLQHILEQWEFI